MKRVVLTARAIERMRPPAKGRVELWDAVLPGLGLRVTENGAKSFMVMSRFRGKLVRYTIDSYPKCSLADARTEARDVIQMMARGEDPRERRRQREAREEAGTFKAVANDFLERSAKQTRTHYETARIVKTELLPTWEDVPIEQIRRADVVALLDEIVDRDAPVMANRTLGVISRIFSWALDRGLVDAHPCARLKKPGRETKRERVYSDDEIRKLWPAWEEIGFPYGVLFRFLLVTAQRRGEAAEMRRADVNVEGKSWAMPTTKAGHGHEVPLTALALQILAEAHKKEGEPTEGELIFTTTGKGAVNGFSKAVRRARKLSGVADFRPHDLRRTAATNMARLGIPKVTISRVLNHAEGGVTSIYARHSYGEEKRDALERWAVRLEQILKEKNADQAASQDTAPSAQEQQSAAA